MDNPIKLIIETVRRYSLDSLIGLAIERIDKKESVAQPWILLAYFEIVYREADNNVLKTRGTQVVFNSICQQIFELMNNHAFADFKKHNPKKMFHVLAYQQFPYQNQYREIDIKRQYFLFNADNENSLLNRDLKHKYGISVRQYLDLFSAISSQSKNSSVGAVAETIMKKWTINHDMVKTKLEKFSNGIGNDFYKTFVPEFFIKYPFIQFAGIHFCIDNRLFKRTVHEFLFSQVLESVETKSSFDKRFQNYFKKTLEEINIGYKTDIELKSIGDNECDFLISDFLFAECKAIKLDPLTQVNPTDKILKNNLRDISKAYKQIISTANRFQIQKNEPFGIIITYLPFYFSDGADIWDILKLDIEEFLSKNNYDLLVNPENLFFVDLSSWNELTEILKNKGNLILYDILMSAKKRNMDGERMFEFSMHLTEYK